MDSKEQSLVLGDRKNREPRAAQGKPQLNRVWSASCLVLRDGGGSTGNKIHTRMSVTPRRAAGDRLQGSFVWLIGGRPRQIQRLRLPESTSESV